MLRHAMYSFSLHSCIYNDSHDQKRTFLDVAPAQNHPFVGNDLKAFFSFIRARTCFPPFSSLPARCMFLSPFHRFFSWRTGFPARDPTSCEVDREQEVAQWMLFRPGSKPGSVLGSTSRCT